MRQKKAVIIGWLVQGVVLGLLLALALLIMLTVSGDGRIFRYQGF